MKVYASIHVVAVVLMGPSTGRLQSVRIIYTEAVLQTWPDLPTWELYKLVAPVAQHRV